ncbi:MAG TPA: O-antigen ligase family protein [Bryobacteraceae bacterium]|nr:O-antigen ligase family protein [Bryobacteraceae bacterium]
MSDGGPSPLLWATGLWAALLAGIVTAWSPRYWAVSVAITSIAILTIIWTTVSLVNRSHEIRWPLQTGLVILIGAWGFLQTAVHATVAPQLTLDSSLVWGISACAFVLGAQILRNRAALRLFLTLFLWSSTILAVAAMLQFYSMPVQVFGIFPAERGVTGTFLSSNQFAAFMELAAPVALWYMLDRTPLIGGLCYTMILAATITAASRAGAILVGAELLVFLGIAITTRKRKTILAISAGLALLVAAAATIAGTDAISARFADKKPYAIRQELFDSTVKLIEQRPWLGYGMGTWRAVYPRAATFDMALLANEAHNDWAQWAAEGGLPFSILMAALVVWAAKPAIRSVWGLGILSVMAHSYFDYPIREPALSFVWFALAGAVSQVNGRSRPVRKIYSGTQTGTSAG